MKQLTPEHAVLFNSAVTVRERLMAVAKRATDPELKAELWALAQWLGNGLKARSVCRQASYRPSRGGDEAK